MLLFKFTLVYMVTHYCACAIRNNENWDILMFEPKLSGIYLQ